MRRILCFLLFAALALSLVACGDTNIETQGESSFDTEMVAPDSVESKDEALSDEKAISENSDGKKKRAENYFPYRLLNHIPPIGMNA